VVEVLDPEGRLSFRWLEPGDTLHLDPRTPVPVPWSGRDAVAWDWQDGWITVDGKRVAFDLEDAPAVAISRAVPRDLGPDGCVVYRAGPELGAAHVAALRALPARCLVLTSEAAPWFERLVPLVRPLAGRLRALHIPRISEDATELRDLEPLVRSLSYVRLDSDVARPVLHPLTTPLVSGSRDLVIGHTSFYVKLGPLARHPLAALASLRSVTLEKVNIPPLPLILLEQIRSLRTLHVTGWSGSFIEHGGKLSALQTLRALRLSGPDIDDQILEEVGRLPELRILELVDADVTDAGLRHLAGLGKLVSLSLRGCRRITGAGLKAIAGLQALRALDLSGTRVDDAGLARLGRRPGLRHLGLAGLGITDAGLRALGPLPALVSLDLHGTPVTDAGLASLGAMPGLRRALLAETAVGDGALRHLAASRGLRVLDLDGTAVTDAGAAFLARLPDLRRLSLRHAHLTDRGCAALAGLVSLRHLDLAWMPISDAALGALGRLTALETLILEDTSVSGTGFVALSRLPRLRTLDLDDSSATDAGLPALGSLRSLRTLTLSRTQVGGAGLSALAALPALTLLILDQTPTTDAGAAALASSRSLRHLVLTWTRVGDAGLASLRAGLPRLDMLQVSRSAVTAAGIKAFIDGRAGGERLLDSPY
jgi:Leucine-rich repeat (LRR) protein